MEYTIEAPVVPLVEQGYPNTGVIEVELGSRQDHFDVLVQFARYFKNEKGFDAPQLVSSDRHSPDTHFKGFLFAENGLNQMTEEHGSITPSIIVGGGCFRYRRDSEGKKHCVLDWIWIHPYERGSRGRKGSLLEQRWAELIELADWKEGILLETPISTSMLRFLRKSDHRDALAPNYRKAVDLHEERYPESR